jgi:hypothetical protein
MNECNRCGSTKAKLADSMCANMEGCERRRIARRIREDEKRGGRQCMASRGASTIRFCIMRERHRGKHTDGGREWGNEEQTEVGRAFAEALRHDGERHERVARNT